jgi:hypothetical protein
VVDHGQILEIGSHHDLIAKSGFYAQLHRSGMGPGSTP